MPTYALSRRLWRLGQSGSLKAHDHHAWNILNASRRPPAGRSSSSTHGTLTLRTCFVLQFSSSLLRSRLSDRPSIAKHFFGLRVVHVCEGALSGVICEAVIAGCLTALMSLLFLGSWRSTLIIAVSIPLSILTSVMILGFLGETINVMTLGGLALMPRPPRVAISTVKVTISYVSLPGSYRSGRIYQGPSARILGT